MYAAMYTAYVRGFSPARPYSIGQAGRACFTHAAFANAVAHWAKAIDDELGLSDIYVATPKASLQTGSQSAEASLGAPTASLPLTAGEH